MCSDPDTRGARYCICYLSVRVCGDDGGAGVVQSVGLDFCSGGGRLVCSVPLSASARVLYSPGTRCSGIKPVGVSTGGVGALGLRGRVCGGGNLPDCV